MATTRLGGWGGPRLPFGSFADKEASALVTVPDITGLSQEAAESALIAEGLTLGAVTESNSASVAVGLVISQDPTSGAEVESGSAVSIVVSLGVAASVAGGWKRDPYRRQSRNRDEEVRQERIRLGILDDDAPSPADTPQETVSKAPARPRKRAKPAAAPVLSDGEITRLIAALEDDAARQRRRRIAAILLLAA